MLHTLFPKTTESSITLTAGVTDAPNAKVDTWLGRAASLSEGGHMLRC